jgi:hypothetical protein
VDVDRLNSVGRQLVIPDTADPAHQERPEPSSLSRLLKNPGPSPRFFNSLLGAITAASESTIGIHPDTEHQMLP